MKISEVSRLLGIKSSAIRFYERHGLLSARKINRADNGYRVYSKKDIEEIRLIVAFKEFGLELKEIKQLLGEESNSCGDLVSSLDRQLQKCREMERLVQGRISSLIKAKQCCESECRPNREVRKCCAAST